MTMFALFDFFQEGSIDVGEWKWVVDYTVIDRENLPRTTEVMVQWPLNAKLLRNLGRKPITLMDNEAKDYPAYVLRTSGDLQLLRELANKLSKCPDQSLLSPKVNDKRYRKKNLKYYDDDDDDDDEGDDDTSKQVKLSAKRRKVSTSTNSYEMELSKKIEAELKSKLGAKSVHERERMVNRKNKYSSDDDHDEDLYEKTLVTGKEKMCALEERNKMLLEENQHLKQMFKDQKSIRDVLRAVKCIEERLMGNETTLLPVNVPRTPSPNRRCLSTKTVHDQRPGVVSESPLSSRSPLVPVDVNQPQCKMRTLWEEATIKEAQWKQLDGKKGNVREFTNLLLRLVFTPDTLSSCSLTGKISNAFKSTKMAKPKLENVDNIISFIIKETGSDEKIVKAAITQLLNTESKRMTSSKEI